MTTQNDATSRARLPGGIELAWDERGDRGDPPLLLVMGLGAQLISWREEFCTALAERGLRVIRFDNRDTGLSTHLDGGAPDIEAVRAGGAVSAPYTLDDMAGDAAALLDALGLDSAHVMGASLGGMIAQTLAARHPERVRSLISIMSTTGRPGVADPSPEATAMLLSPRPGSADEAGERAVAAAHVWGSRGLLDEDAIRELGRASFERSFDPAGFARQLAAIYASGDRTESLRAVRAPTLVIHGALDTLVPEAGGRATAAAISGAELLVIDEMGHDLPRALWPRLVDAIAAHVERAERGV